MWRQLRKPPMFLLDLCNVCRATRHPDHHIIAQTEGPIVPASRLDHFYRQALPFGKLLLDQSMNQLVVDLYAICILHPASESW
ncbi:hypothetical protein WS48_18295 [Burkholderia sp. RF7-non_BP1]|nr:hypothetical protein WS45_05735 [Burkholderia sp. RF2-non_BP3]KUY85933.1 hypothetical protein WS46_05565 [Burkholderia sp. RF4-BP95]KUY92807.1 hypothetical protein WS49_26705 [Burkholderia sp. RF7-non_BP4]KUY95314.1 hypothetical protein WS48_18295 [Burkholderia sp. RF7-non_BP1]